MNELIVVNQDNMTVSARDLHDALEATERFSVWINRYLPNFIKGEEYTSVRKLTVVGNGAGREVDDYLLSVDTAKHICLMSRTEKGKQCRQYLIDMEKAWNSPEQVMARALKLADKTIHMLTLQLEEQKPLVEFAEHVSQSADMVDMGEMAKLAKAEGINIGRNKLIDWMKSKKYLMPSRAPYQKYVDAGYMKLVDVPKKTAYGSRTFQKPVFTGKGQIWIIEKLRKEYKQD